MITASASFKDSIGFWDMVMENQFYMIATQSRVSVKPRCLPVTLWQGKMSEI